MSPGIRATVTFSTPEICPIADFSRSAETTIDTRSVSVCPADCTECVTEFVVDTNLNPSPDIAPVFSLGSTSWFRLTHDQGDDCPCTVLGRLGCPVVRYVATDGDLMIAFHASDYEQLREIVGELRERFPNVNLKRFIRSPTDPPKRDTVFVDRGKLTARQLEVVRAAYELGYFERPRRTNATDIAKEFDIDPSTFREHLVTAQQKLLADILEEGA